MGNHVITNLRSAAIAWGVLFTVAGCGDTVTYVDCPLGTIPQGADCVPIQQDTGSLVADTEGSGDTGETGDTSAAVDTQVANDGQGEDASGVDTSVAPQATGSACVKNAECAGGTCLDWPGGYCTTLDCGADSCPDGASCVVIGGTNKVCLSDCDGDQACRSGGQQACKNVAVGDAMETRAEVCTGVASDAGDLGFACSSPVDCAGAATCLASFPGGYCGVLGCDAFSCPAGGRCVRVDGVDTCLRGCSVDGDCDSEVGAERRCGVLQGSDGVETMACISGIVGKEMGDACVSDFECDSGTCETLGDGRCSDSGAPCFVASVDVDCGGAAFCQITGDSRVGVCSQPCSVGGLPCPGASFCVAEGDNPSSGSCREVCTSGADTTTCLSEGALVCAWGIPLNGGAQGRFVCGRRRPGGVGATCINDTQCSSGSCLMAGAGASGGYCTGSCGDDGYCPFGGACVVDGAEECYRACQSAGDCPSGFRCGKPSGTNRDVCTPL